MAKKKITESLVEDVESVMSVSEFTHRGTRLWKFKVFHKKMGSLDRVQDIHAYINDQRVYLSKAIDSLGSSKIKNLILKHVKGLDVSFDPQVFVELK